MQNRCVRCYCKEGKKRQYLQNKDPVAFLSSLLRYDKGAAKNNSEQELGKMELQFLLILIHI